MPVQQRQRRSVAPSPAASSVVSFLHERARLRTAPRPHDISLARCDLKIMDGIHQVAMGAVSVDTVVITKMATADESSSRRRPMDPLFTLHAGPGHGVVGNVLFGSTEGKDGEKVGVSSAVSSVCFIRDPYSYDDAMRSESSESDDSSDEDDEPLRFRCSQMLLGKEAEAAAKENAATSAGTSAAAAVCLRGSLMASSHANGCALIWDLGTRRVVSQFADGGSRGPGLAMRRMGDGCVHNDNSQSRVGCHRFFYHSRGKEGLVSVHDTQPNGSIDTLVHYKTRCRTFCAASSCSSGGSEGRHLLALPTRDECTAAVVDIRVDPTSQPVFVIHGAALAGAASGASEEWRKHGMLTSLSLCGTSSNSETIDWSSSGPILACGMESGSVFFHDLAMPGRAMMDSQPEFDGKIAQRHRPTMGWDDDNSFTYLTPPHCSVSLGRDPVLALDIAASSVSQEEDSRGAVIAVGGCAGDQDDLAAKPLEEQKTVGVIKATFDRSQHDSALKARIRSRIQTCSIGENTARGKPGVGTCRFRPDGRMFAVGGWDKRLRVFSRAAGAAPLALMRAHIDSVTAIDWAPDCATSGILATGSEDGQIAIWRAFPHTGRQEYSTS